MMVVRVHGRGALAALCVVALLILLYWLQRLPDPPHPGMIPNTFSERTSVVDDDIECVINGEYSVACKRDKEEVYVPFSFIHKYFEVYGKLSNDDGTERFEWSHSYSKIYHPKKKYDPRGTFTTFENYNVEVRERVKCVSAIEGVPVSTQWDPKGFYYPTQIAQYGLAHYSKNVTESEPRVTYLNDGEITSNWASNDATLVSEFDSIVKSNVLRFSTSSAVTSQVEMKVNVSQDFCLNLDLMLKPNSSMTVVLLHKDGGETVYLHYVAGAEMISAQDEHIFYGVAADGKWRSLTRDLIIDMQKGWALQDKPKRKTPRNKFRVSSLIFHGTGAIDNITISSSAHWAAVLSAADWLVRNQRQQTGGWPVPVARRVIGRASLAPGWHSAMSQGHAISLLARVYHRTKNEKYIAAAKRALNLLDMPKKSGGVRAMWAEKYVWFEEYPTKPPLFVLNGFIYTLLGLYDLHVIEGENAVSMAKKLFNDGMRSLKTVLPLYDTGSGSFYDLRHYTFGVSPNIARWDYHATHVNQLYLLAGLDSDPVIINTAKRWEGYMRGKRAAHN